LLGGLAGGSLTWILQGHSFSVFPAGISYPDLIAVLLTGIGLFLAILGVYLGVLAFVGWVKFKGMVRESVEAIVPAYLSHELRDGESRQVLRDIVSDFIRAHAENPGALDQYRAERDAQAKRLKELDASEE
jgi:hypothetical protein